MGEMIRVLHILGSAQRGGTESVVFNNYRAIDRSNVQFDIVIDNCSPCDVPESIVTLGCHVYKIPPYTKPFGYIKEIMNICKQGRYRIIHSHMNGMSVVPLFAAWLSRVPVRIAHSHSTAGGGDDFKRDMFKYLLRPFSKVFATHLFACSEHAGRWLFGNKSFEKGKVAVINNAIFTEGFKFNQDQRNELRRSLGLDDKFVVGHIGRFSPQKNHSFLIEVFNNVCKIRKDAYLILIGGLGSSGGGIEDGIRRRINELGLQNNVLFMGTTEDTRRFYQIMDVFVLPSLYEGLGMVAIEAQCSGLPCVLSDRVPQEAKINDSVHFLSLKETKEKWARIVSNTESQRSDCSAKIAKAGYDINVVAGRLEKMYISYGERFRGDNA